MREGFSINDLDVLLKQFHNTYTSGFRIFGTKRELLVGDCLFVNRYVSVRERVACNASMHSEATFPTSTSLISFKF